MSPIYHLVGLGETWSGKCNGYEMLRSAALPDASPVGVDCSHRDGQDAARCLRLHGRAAV